MPTGAGRTSEREEMVLTNVLDRKHSVVLFFGARWLSHANGIFMTI